MSDNKTVTIVTPPFRLSFPVLAEPKPGPNGGEPKFSIVMLFPKAEDLTAMRRLASDCIKAKYPDPDTRPNNIRSPFKDGDQPNGEGRIPNGHAGMVVVNAGTKFRPGMVDQQCQPILCPKEQLYGGCWCRAQVNVFFYNQSGNKGVSFGLLNIQKVRDDEAFSGRERAEDVFKPLEGDNNTGSTGNDDFLV